MLSLLSLYSLQTKGASALKDFRSIEEKVLDHLKLDGKTVLEKANILDKFLAGSLAENSPLQIMSTDTLRDLQSSKESYETQNLNTLYYDFFQNAAISKKKGREERRREDEGDDRSPEEKVMAYVFSDNPGRGTITERQLIAYVNKFNLFLTNSEIALDSHGREIVLIASDGGACITIDSNQKDTLLKNIEKYKTNSGIKDRKEDMEILDFVRGQAFQKKHDRLGTGYWLLTEQERSDFTLPAPTTSHNECSSQ